LWEIRDGIFKLLRSPGIDSRKSIQAAYVVWACICKRFKEVRNRFLARRRAGTKTLFVIPARHAT
jgi:hypothetical protein